MFIVRQTEEFQTWLDGLRDKRAQVRIAARLRLAEAGNLGDWAPVGGDISEMRVDVGPGYRLYFTRRRSVLIVMLCGGDKSTQKGDIRRAREIARQVKEAARTDAKGDANAANRKAKPTAKAKRAPKPRKG